MFTVRYKLLERILQIKVYLIDYLLLLPLYVYLDRLLKNMNSWAEKTTFMQLFGFGKNLCQVFGNLQKLEVSAKYINPSI